MLYRSLVDISLPLIFLMGEEKLFCVVPEISKRQGLPLPLFLKPDPLWSPHIFDALKASVIYIYIFLQRWSEQNQGLSHPPYLDQIRTTTRNGVLYFFGIGNSSLSFFLRGKRTCGASAKFIFRGNPDLRSIDGKWRTISSFYFSSLPFCRRWHYLTAGLITESTNYEINLHPPIPTCKIITSKQFEFEY